MLDEAITEAVRLSHRYISGRQLPDKAVGVLDTACAKVALGQSATPALIEEARRAIERLDAESAALERDTAAGGRYVARLAELAEQKAAAQADLVAHEARLAKEGALVTKPESIFTRAFVWNLDDAVAQWKAASEKAADPADWVAMSGTLYSGLKEALEKGAAGDRRQAL